MTVTNQSGSLLDSVLAAQTTNQNVNVAVLKKAEDVVKEEGAGEEQLLNAATPDETSSGSAPLLDAYA